MHVAAAVLIGGALLATLGVVVAPPRGAATPDPPLLQQLLYGAWFASLPVGAALLLAFQSLKRRRLRRFERRAGFLPRPAAPRSSGWSTGSAPGACA